MATIVPALPDLPEPAPVDLALINSFELHLRAERLSANTLDCYLSATRLLARWTAHTRRCGLAGLRRQDLEAWLVWLLNTARTRRGRPYSPGYVNNLFRSVQQFFVWLAAAEEIANPMVGMKAPKVHTTVVPVLKDEQIADLLRQVEKHRDFDARRDYAILRLFLCSGVRLSELTNLTVPDVDLPNAAATIMGKGGKQRVIKFDMKTAVAIDRYLRLRAAHKQAACSPRLWLGTNHRSPLTPNGVRQMIRRRARAAGLEIHPHLFRHNFSHRWLDAGGAEGDLMELNGWSSPQMLRRYGASARSARAQRAYDRLDVMGGM